MDLIFNFGSVYILSLYISNIMSDILDKDIQDEYKPLTMWNIEAKGYKIIMTMIQQQIITNKRSKIPYKELEKQFRTNELEYSVLLNKIYRRIYMLKRYWDTQRFIFNIFKYIPEYSERWFNELKEDIIAL